MLPPPALTVSIRIAGSASGTPATAPVPSCTAVPPVTRLASALVPPISSVSSSDSPTALGGEKGQHARTRPRSGSRPLPRRDDARYLGVAQRLLPPRRPHALGEPHNVRPGDQRRGMIARQVVQRSPVLPPEPEQVLETARGYEHHPRPPPLQQRAGRDRRAVH